MSQSLISCSICHKPVRLETTKTDASGLAVHEDCYVQVVVRDENTPARKNPKLAAN